MEVDFGLGRRDTYTLLRHAGALNSFEVHSRVTATPRRGLGVALASTAGQEWLNDGPGVASS